MDKKKWVSGVKKLLAEFPELTYDSAKKSVKGELTVAPYDFYEIKICLNELQAGLPRVFEIGGRIPASIDRHKYEPSDQLCLTTNAVAEVLQNEEEFDLTSFVRELITPFLQNNSFYEIKGRYACGEYAHGAEGILQGYMDILNIKHRTLTIAAMIHRIDSFKNSNEILCNQLCKDMVDRFKPLMKYDRLLKVSETQLVSDFKLIYQTFLMNVEWAKDYLSLLKGSLEFLRAQIQNLPILGEGKHLFR
ncbi:MAG: hypothetical protein WBA74_08480 [Cyclobacteriaceae bacterium]